MGMSTPGRNWRYSRPPVSLRAVAAVVAAVASGACRGARHVGRSLVGTTGLPWLPVALVGPGKGCRGRA